MLMSYIVTLVRNTEVCGRRLHESMRYCLCRMQDRSTQLVPEQVAAKVGVVRLLAMMYSA